MNFTNPTAGGRIQAQSEAWDGTSIRVTRDCAGHRATNQGCALDLGDGRCTRSVLAVAAGTVTYRDNVQGIVRIDHGGGRTSEYAHMSPLMVSVGTRVTQGQQIGEIGDAHDPAVLNFSGCHLHFGIRLNGVEQDPWPLLDQNIAGDEMTPGTKPTTPPIGTFTLTDGRRSLISPTQPGTFYPQPQGGTFDVIAGLDLKDVNGKPVDIGGTSPPFNNRDQVWLVDGPRFGATAWALRQDGTFTPTPSADLKAAYNKGLADAKAAVEAVPPK